MEQSDIIQESINRFADKLKKIANTKIMDPIEHQSKDDQPVIMITVLGMEEVVVGNMNERFQIKDKDEKGNVVEFLMPPASHFNISVMVTPYFKTYSDTLKIIGLISRLFKDDNQIPVDKFDWVSNEKNPIFIYPISGMTLEKQMQIFNMIRSDYRPSLFYQFTVGIDSSRKEIIRRVEERKITAFPKKD
jgi:hypothetical protein